MKTEFRHLEFNILDLNSVKSFYEDIFKFFEYVILEEDDNHIKFVSNTSDFTFHNVHEDHPHYDPNIGIREVNFFAFSKNDVDNFYNEFLKPRNIPALDQSPKYYNKKYYAVSFMDPQNYIKWEVFYAPHEDTKSIKENLRKNFLKEFIYSFLLCPYGFWYFYKLSFQSKHKLAGIICLIITLLTILAYVQVFISIGNMYADINNSIQEVYNIRY